MEDRQVNKNEVSEPENKSEKTKPPSNKRWNWLIHVFKLAITFVLLFLLVRMIKRDALLEALRSAEMSWMIWALLLVPLNLALQGLRWYIFVRTEAPNISYSRCFNSFLGGLSMGLITPGRVGEVGRVFLLDAPSRVRLAGLHILDKLYFVFAIALFGPALLFFMPGFREALPEKFIPGISLLVLVLPFLYFFFAMRPHPVKGLLLAIQLTIGAKGRTLELLNAYNGVRTKDCLKATTITFTQIFIILTQFFFLSRAFEPVNWLTAAHTYASALFVKTALPISLGSLGVGEWAAVSFYQRYGIADTTGFSASLILFGLNVLLPGLAGLVVLQRLNPTSILLRISQVWRKAA